MMRLRCACCCCCRDASAAGRLALLSRESPRLERDAVGAAAAAAAAAMMAAAAEGGAPATAALPRTRGTRKSRFEETRCLDDEDDENACRGRSTPRLLPAAAAAARDGSDEDPSA